MYLNSGNIYGYTFMWFFEELAHQDVLYENFQEIVQIHDLNHSKFLFSN